MVDFQNLRYYIDADELLFTIRFLFGLVINNFVTLFPFKMLMDVVLTSIFIWLGNSFVTLFRFNENEFSIIRSKLGS